MVYLLKAEGKWLQCVGGGARNTDTMRLEMAAHFGLDPGTVTLIERDGGAPEAEAIVAALATGTFEGLAVTSSPPPPVPPRGRDFLRAAVTKLTAATPLVPGTNGKIARCAALVRSDPAWAAIVHVCNVFESIPPEDRAFVRELWASVTLTAPEKTAIQGIAATYGLTLP